MRNYAALSFIEYEKLVGDLLGAELGVRFERFGAGSDDGIDLRHLVDGAGPDIVQVKHYLGSTWSDLKKAAKAEKKRLVALSQAPGRYRFVTSQSLTPARKSELQGMLAPFIASVDDVIGAEEVDDLLDRHEEVERRHVKLWLASAAALQALTRGGLEARSRQLAADIERKLPLWVQSDAFFEARERLASERAVVISGQPGIGKTTLAQVLVADAIDLGFEPIAVSADVEEAWTAFAPGVRQVFLYDDFLGQTSLVELTKNEDSRLVSLLQEVARSKSKLFVLTTREYILQRALQVSERLRWYGLSASRILLELPSYSALDRARILANHVWQSNALPRSVRTQLAEDRGYRRIVDHPNYNPRLIEFITGHLPGAVLEVDERRTWLDAAIDALDHPSEIWRAAYERQLGDVERGLVLVLATFVPQAQLDDLRAAHDAWCLAAGVPDSPRRFERALEVVDDSFFTTGMDEGEHVVRFANPGVRDYIEQQLRDDPGAFGHVLDGLIFFEQLSMLWRMVRDREDVLLRRALMCVVAGAADRVFESPSATWITHQSWSGERKLKRYGRRLDARLGVILDLAGAADAPAAIREWIFARLQERVEAWREGSGDASDAIALARRLSREPPVEPPSDWKVAIKTVITSHPWGPEEWRHVIDFHALQPELFSAIEWQDLGFAFLGSAESFLVENADNLDSRDEIDTMSVIAEEFGLELDSSWLEHADEELGRKLAAKDAHDEMEYERWREERRPSKVDASGEMDALFYRLADS